MHATVREEEYAYSYMVVYSLFSCQSEQLPAEKPHVKNMDLEKCNSRGPKNRGSDLIKPFLMPNLS